MSWPTWSSSRGHDAESVLRADAGTLERPNSSARRARLLRRTVTVASLLALIAGPTLVGVPALAATVSPNVNVTRMGGNQSEAAIAIDPLNPSNAVELSNKERGVGLVLARSSDGGLTWQPSLFASDDPTFGSACCDATMSWDAFGNLFIAWLDIRNAGAIPIALSTDAGASFRLLKVLHPLPPGAGPGRPEPAISLRRDGGDEPEDDEPGHDEKPGGGEKPREPSRNGSSVDQPTITTGAGSVWITWNNDGSIQAVGAPVTGLGQVGTFIKREDIDKTVGCSFGDISIGPQGQVFDVCTKDNRSARPVVAGIRGAVDPDGLGPKPFTAARLIGSTNVRQFDPIRPQRSRTVDAETGLAWDADPSSAHFGRLYLMYTDESPPGSSNTDIWLRSSDDDGATWSTPAHVNDVTQNAQFNPRIAIDQTTGNLAIGWHDARNDLRAGGPADTDGNPNTDAMYFLTLSVDGGATFLPALQVSAGASNAADAHNGIDFGDYSGLAFQSGIAMPAWADNSNSTGDNPGGTLHTFDIYTAQIACC